VKRVLIDGAHFLSKTATGIGSYARTLAASLQSAGCHVSIVYGQRVQARLPQDARLRLAAQMFGHEPPAWRGSRLVRDASFLLGAAVGRSRRARPFNVPVDGVDLSAFEPSLPPSDEVLNAYGLFERAYRLFGMKERFLELELPNACELAHWTWPLSIKVRGAPNIYTIHDMIPLKFPYFVVDRGGRAVQLHSEVARQADHIITVSQSSKQQIVDLLDVPEDRVSVTYQPAPSLPLLEQERAERLVQNVYGVRSGEYALFLGAIEPKKNLKRLIEAFLLAGVDIPLLLAGPLGWLYDEDLALLDVVGRQAHGRVVKGEVFGNVLTGQIRDDRPPVRHLGYLPRHHVVALLQCARMFLFPSLHEGFGLPVLEAMQLGVPVLTSNTSSLPEVAGEAAVLVDPLSVSAMAREIERLTMDGDLRADLSRRGPMQAAKFSKENYRVRLAAAYKNVGLELENVDGGCKSPQREKTFEHAKISGSATVAPYDLSR
jgi:glycosyltransferase involved in cell wall biosynthesis